MPEFGALVGHDVLDALTLEFYCCVEVWANYLVPEEVPDSSLEMGMTPAYFNDIIDEVSLPLGILGDFMVDLSLRDIREDKHLLEHALLFEELRAVFSSLRGVHDKEFEALAESDFHWDVVLNVD